MCRVLVSSFDRGRLGEFRDLLRSFVEASRNDVVLGKISRRASHGDGFGLAAIGSIDGAPVVLFHKSILPIYHGLSTEILSLFAGKMEVYDSVKAVVHSRLSGRGEPYGERYAHPFEVSSGNLFIWFVHNGGVDKVDLSKSVGVNPYGYTDSWVAAIYLFKQLSECAKKPEDLDSCVASAYRGLLNYVVEGSAMNTGLLVLHGSEAKLYSTFYIDERGRADPSRREYYEMYGYAGSGIVSISSSTIKYYSDKDWKVLEPGLYSIERSGLKELDSYAHE